MVGLVCVVRFAYTSPANLDYIAVVSANTGVDFGAWPAWFYAGANGDAPIFAVFAADPFVQGPANLVLQTGYRFTMVGFSWLAAILSFGQSSLIFIAMSVIGAACVGAMAYITIRQRDHLGWPAWLLVANPALIVGFLGNTAEPLALLLLTLAFITTSSWSTGFLAMVRPPYLTGVADMPRKLLIGLVVAGVFRVGGAWLVGTSPFEGTAVALGLPFVGFLETPSLLGGLVLASALATVFLGIRRKSWSWVLSGLLVLMMSATVYDTPVNAVRAAGVLPVLWAFSATPTRPKWFSRS